MLTLVIPELKDYWYEKKLNEDPASMSYNAGYDVSYSGYHYDTGTIDFPEENFEKTYKKRKDENKFFAFLKDTKTNEFVGYINYQFNSSENHYDCGILIEASKRGKGYSKEGLKLLCEAAKKNGIKELYDNFEKDRYHTKVFEDVGFKVIKETTGKKFGKDVEGVIVKIEL